MDVLFDPDEQLIRQTAREVLSERSPVSLARDMEKDPVGYSAEVWSMLADLGWLGLSIPAEYGGQGLPMTWTGILLSEIGRHLTPVPFHSTMTAAAVISRHGSAGQKRRLLPAICSGKLLATFAYQEESGSISPESIRLRGTPDGDGYLLTGTKSFVDNFDFADVVLVVFRVDGGERDGALAVAVVATAADGLRITPLITTAKDRQSEVRFDGVRVVADDILPAEGVDEGDDAPAVGDLLDLATALLCAQLGGATRKDLEMAVEYAKHRVAFGRPIAAFQSLQHMCADMLIWVDGLDLLTYEALWRLDKGLPASVEVSQAKSFAGEKCVNVCRYSQQIHGGIGFMMEFDLQLWYRRIAAWSLRLGNSHEHRARISAALLNKRAGPVRLDMRLELDRRGAGR